VADVLVGEGLEKVYGEGVVRTVALRGVDVAVAEGDIVGIVGQSGSGKSTLLNLLGLLDRPTAGRVLVAGRDTAGLDRRDLAATRARELGFVFQFHHLLPELTVWENVTLPARIGGGRVGAEERRWAESLLGLLDVADVAGKGATAVSGGQRQRVAIARALMNRPRLLLADEPTGNLDTVNTERVHELFRRINAELGTTVVVVTHDAAVAARTDRIVEVRDGRLVEDVRNTYGRPLPGGDPRTPL